MCIAHADCRDILPLLPKVDLVLTDPPYGIGYASNRHWETTTAEWVGNEIVGDSDCSLRDYVLSRYMEWACFGSLKTPRPANTRGVLIWDKGEAAGMGDLSFPWKPNFELIFVAGTEWTGRRDSSVLSAMTVVSRKSMGRSHPNEKAVCLMMYLMMKHDGLILDPFMGSGTTLRAAKDLGRKAIGIEIEERYCEIAAKRMSQSVMRL